MNNIWVEFVVGPAFLLLLGALVSRSSARANRRSLAAEDAAKAAKSEAKEQREEAAQLRREAEQRRESEQRTAAEGRRADGEAYERAVSINRQMVDDLMAEVQRLHREVQTLREQLDAKEIRESQLEQSMRALELTVGRLRRLLEEHDIPVPE